MVEISQVELPSLCQVTPRATCSLQYLCGREQQQIRFFAQTHSCAMKVLRSLLISALLFGTTTAFAPAFSTASRRAASLSMSVESVDTKDIIKVGVIGMGRIGLVHLEAITKAPGVTPVIVSNPTISKAEAGTC